MTAETSDQDMVKRVDVLGVGVSAIDLPMAVGIIDRWIQGRDRQYVCITGVHGVMESWRDENLRRIHNHAGLVTPDGMPMVWMLKWAGHKADRVYGPDLMLAVFQKSQSAGYRHFLYGSSPETLWRLKESLLRRFPEAHIVGMHSPPFRPLTPAEDEAACREINESAADIVWIGLSTPKQEFWMAGHRNRLTAPVLIGVGAAFDIHAGTVRQAPRVIQRSGFEWLFRLLQEPRRLFKRYLRNNPQFVFLVLKQKLGL